MNVPILSAGIACVIAAIVGGGMKALGAEIPTIQSTRRQLALGAFGVILIVGAFIIDKPSPKVPDNSVQSDRTVNASSSDIRPTPPAPKPVIQPTPQPSHPSAQQPTLAPPTPQPSHPSAQQPAPAVHTLSSSPNPSQGITAVHVEQSTSTWIDTETGRMWPLLTTHIASSEAAAANYCRDLTLGGYHDWRLPTEQDVTDLETRRYKAPKNRVDVREFYVWLDTSADPKNLLDKWSFDLASAQSEANRPVAALCLRQ